MEEKKCFLSDKKKRLIAVAVAILILIILLLLLLRGCGGKKGGDGNDDGGASITTTTSAVEGDGNNGEGDGVSTNDTTAPAPEDIEYDDELVSTWYKLDTAMVLSEEGYGSLYYGDEDGGEFQWYTVGNRLTLVTAEGTKVATYAIDGDDLNLTFDDGTTETWIR